MLRGAAGGVPAVLLPVDSVTGPGTAQVFTDHALGLTVGGGDRGQVGLGLDLEVLGVEVAGGEAVHLVGNGVGQEEVVAPAALRGRGEAHSPNLPSGPSGQPLGGRSVAAGRRARYRG